MAFDLYTRLRRDVKELQRKRLELDSKSERAEFAGAVPAFTLATAPTTGVGDNLSYTSVCWISDGRKSGEGAGNGTGVLAYWQASASAWYGVRSEVAVTT